MIEKLRKALEDAGETGIKVLKKEASAEAYVEDLKSAYRILLSLASEDIKDSGYPENIENTIRMDRYLLEGTLTEEQDCLSLLSTLVTYIAAYLEGLPEHSKVYMDRVTDLRHVIDEVYGAKAMPFCGTGEC